MGYFAGAVARDLRLFGVVFDQFQAAFGDFFGRDDDAYLGEAIWLFFEGDLHGKNGSGFAVFALVCGGNPQLWGRAN